MNADEILVKLTNVFRDVFDLNDLAITPKTTARDVDGWNSLANIRLMVVIEEEFGIKFDVGEFQEFRNVGDLVAGIARRTA